MKIKVITDTGEENVPYKMEVEADNQVDWSREHLLSIAEAPDGFVMVEVNEKPGSANFIRARKIESVQFEFPPEEEEVKVGGTE